jgi:hypothetical protein
MRVLRAGISNQTNPENLPRVARIRAHSGCTRIFLNSTFIFSFA